MFAWRLPWVFQLETNRMYSYLQDSYSQGVSNLLIVSYAHDFILSLSEDWFERSIQVALYLGITIKCNEYSYEQLFTEITELKN